MDWSFAGGFWPVFARGLSDAGALLLFGASLFHAATLPRALAGALPAAAADARRRVRRLVLAAAALSIGALVLWLAIEAQAMASMPVFQAIPPVVRGTLFGQVIVLQLAAAALAGAASAVLPRRPAVAACAAGLLVILGAGHAHAYAEGGALSPLVASEAVHLLAAGAWLGALPVLLVMTLRDPPHVAAAAARWFSPPGQLYVVAMAATASMQEWGLVGSLHALRDTSYGAMTLVKASLLLVLTIYALANRYRFAPALLGAEPVAARRRLLRSLAVQTAFGAGVIAAAAMLASLSPATDEQPGQMGAVVPAGVDEAALSAHLRPQRGVHDGAQDQ